MHKSALTPLSTQSCTSCVHRPCQFQEKAANRTAACLQLLVALMVLEHTSCPACLPQAVANLEQIAEQGFDVTVFVYSNAPLAESAVPQPRAANGTRSFVCASRLETEGRCIRASTEEESQQQIVTDSAQEPCRTRTGPHGATEPRRAVPLEP